jgi:hypothetical protein
MKIVSDICIFVNKYFCCCFSKGEKVRPQNDPSQLGSKAKSDEKLSQAPIVGLQHSPSTTGSEANKHQAGFPQLASQSNARDSLENCDKITTNEPGPQTTDTLYYESLSPRSLEYLANFGLRNNRDFIGFISRASETEANFSSSN